MNQLALFLEAWSRLQAFVNSVLPSFTNQLANQRGRIYSVEPPPRIN